MKYGIRNLKIDEARRLLLGWIITHKKCQGFIANNIHTVRIPPVNPPELPLTQKQAEEKWKKEVYDIARTKLGYQIFRQDDIVHLRRGFALLGSHRRARGGSLSGRSQAS